MRGRALLFLQLLFMTSAIFAAKTDSTEEKVGQTVTTMGLIALLTTKIGAIKALLISSSGFIIPLAQAGTIVGIGYGLKKGWDWFNEEKISEVIKKNIKELKKWLNQRMGRLEAKTERLIKKVDEVKKEVNALDENIGSMNDNLEKNAKEAREKFELLDKSVRGVDENVQDLRKEQSKQFKNVATRAQVSLLEGSQQAIQEGQEELASRMSEKLLGINDKLTTAEEGHEELLRDIARLQGEFDEGRIKSLLDSVHSCKGAIDKLNSRTVSIDKTLETMNSLQESNDFLHKKVDLILDFIGSLRSDDKRNNKRDMTSKESSSIMGIRPFSRPTEALLET